MRHRDGAAATGQAHSLGCFSDRELCTCGALHSGSFGPSAAAKASHVGEPCLSHAFTAERIQTKRQPEQAEHESIETPGTQI